MRTPFDLAALSFYFQQEAHEDRLTDVGVLLGGVCLLIPHAGTTTSCLAWMSLALLVNSSEVKPTRSLDPSLDIAGYQSLGLGPPSDSESELPGGAWLRRSPRV
eukprot:COSAG01_NODE_16146_length_1265_cov_21.296741_2_plen_104_part_00